jgi:DNA-binding transcriptional LysR family regulator
MNSKQLRYVLVLAREKSFSSAAQILHISQPSLSQFIKKIEDELGVTLFDRNGGECRLTDAGEVYIEAGRKILDLERQMENRLSDIAQKKAGRITIGISPYRAARILPKAVYEYRKKYPKVEVRLLERAGPDLIDGITNGEFDLCLTALPVNERLFSCEHIMDEKILLAVQKGSVYEQMIQMQSVPGKDLSVDLTQLQNMDFIVLGKMQLMQNMLTNICEDYGLQINVVAECVNIETQLSLVREGVGVALIPSSMADYWSDSVSFYSIKQSVPRRDIVVIYRKEQYMSELITEFIDILKKCVK